MKLLDNVQYIVIDNSFAGPQDLLQYYFKGINHCAEDGAGRKGLFVDITLGRPKTSNMITIFLPTGMLVLISHLIRIYKSLRLKHGILQLLSDKPTSN